MLKVKGNRGACLPSCRFTAVLSSYKKSNLSGSSVYQQSNPDCLQNCLECKNYFVVSHFNLHTQLSRRNDMDINCTFPRPQPFQQAFQLHTFLWSREKKRAGGLWFAARFVLVFRVSQAVHITRGSSSLKLIVLWFVFVAQQILISFSIEIQTYISWSLLYANETAQFTNKIRK